MIVLSKPQEYVRGAVLLYINASATDTGHNTQRRASDIPPNALRLDMQGPGRKRVHHSQCRDV